LGHFEIVGVVADHGDGAGSKAGALGEQVQLVGPGLGPGDGVVADYRGEVIGEAERRGCGAGPRF
jgi:hypothetical protein